MIHLLAAALLSSTAFARNGVPLEPICTPEERTACNVEALSAELECSNDMLDCLYSDDPVACVEDFVASHDLDDGEDDICQAVGDITHEACLEESECTVDLNPLFP